MQHQDNRHWNSPAKKIVKNPWLFISQVIKGFNANQGLLLAGAVAYYTLLSIIPLLSLILIVLSNFISTDELLSLLNNLIQIVLPLQANILSEQLSQFIEQQHIGWLFFIILIFFSSMTFTVLEKAMCIIFFHRVNIHRRHYLVSAIIPYVYIVILGLGVLLVTFISGMLQLWETQTIHLIQWHINLTGLTQNSLYFFGILGLLLMLTSLYMVMPVGKLSFKHALVGSASATVLWEISRHIMVWYFSTLSMVNEVYGSFAGAIIILLFLEVGAIILLFGAQVIAEYERLGYGEDCQGCESMKTQ
ncbi:MAG: YihY/virulence factor BrkB family protein [Gammaproteobacteria bacterium]|nr:YihY/virulence factor BrkB family protein [Gammaproteobacteria bacterium]